MRRWVARVRRVRLRFDLLDELHELRRHSARRPGRVGRPRPAHRRKQPRGCRHRPRRGDDLLGRHNARARSAWPTWMGRARATLYTGESQPSGVAIDPAAGLIYWADAVTGSGIDPGREARRQLAPGRCSRGECLPGREWRSIRPTGKIYWGSYDTFKIRVGNLDGTGASGHIRGRELIRLSWRSIPPLARYDWSNELGGNVRVGNLDGTGATNLYAGEGDVGGVAIDPVGREDLLDELESRARLGSGASTAPRRHRASTRARPTAWFGRAPARAARHRRAAGLG